ARDVTVSTLGVSSAAVPFTVLGIPTLSTISPDSGITGNTVNVTLTGTNFKATATGIQVDGTGVTVSSVAVSGTTAVTATFTIASNASLGAHNVRITTGGGESNALTFTV